MVFKQERRVVGLARDGKVDTAASDTILTYLAMSDNLTTKKCVPCQGGIPPLTQEQTKPFLAQIDPAWQVIEGKKIRRELSFTTFTETIAFLNKVAALAEEEGHHPDFHIHYSKLVIELWTHKIDGLHDNDFIMAAKIDAMYKSGPSLH